MALTGYDDIALGQYCDTPFTTVRQPNRAMADAAVQMLLRLIAGEKITQKERLQLFPCEVIVRASSNTRVSHD
jgi:DNA-binding LacI/PurR family transcriptional regulator